MRCPQCRAESPPTATTCPRCGTALDHPDGPPRAPVGDPRAARPTAEDETVATIIPYKNAAALTAYYLGLFSCLPVLGLPMAIIALVLGIKGLRAANRDPSVYGTAHAWVGLICGTIGLLVNGLALLVIVLALVSARA